MKTRLPDFPVAPDPRMVRRQCLIHKLTGALSGLGLQLEMQRRGWFATTYIISAESADSKFITVLSATPPHVDPELLRNMPLNILNLRSDMSITYDMMPVGNIVLKADVTPADVMAAADELERAWLAAVDMPSIHNA